MLARVRLRSKAPLAKAALLLAAAGCAPQGGADAGLDEPRVAGGSAALALAGADLVALEGQRVQLDGHASRALGPSPLSLTWSQVEGPPVLLTSPTGPAPAFVAPLAPSSLRFRLRAESGGDVDVDEVAVEVRDQPGPAPVFLEAPADAVGAPGEQSAFSVNFVGTPAGEVQLEANARCDGASALIVEGSLVRLAVPNTLPCAVVVDGRLPDGRRTAPVARVLWPPTTPLGVETRVQAPVLIDPGAEALLRVEEVRDGDESRAWPAGGVAEGLPGLSRSPLVTLHAPRRRTRLYLGVERRRGAASGGIRYVPIDVGAGGGNRAPVASAGIDRTVRPGAAFRIDTGGSVDLDGDPLALELTQVLGPLAAPDPVQTQVFVAPGTAGTLLFHVTAFDQRVFSEVDTVRVVVDPEAEGRAPILTLQPERYVAPGETFTLDASSASDPDSGLLASFSITQHQDDEVVLLAEPVAAPSVQLVAGEDGDVYRFRLAVFDADGLAATADVNVFVERAGPYVDRSRGTPDGDGTPGAPFDSVARALPVAARHAFSELRLGAGEQEPFGGELPPGLSLRGGFRWDFGAWVSSDVPSKLPLVGPGLAVRNADLRDLVLSLEAPEAQLGVEGQSHVVGVRVEQGPLHRGGLVRIGPGAVVNVESTSVLAPTPRAPVDSTTLLEVGAGASLRLTGSTLEGGPGGERVALHCEQATVDLIESDVVAALPGLEPAEKARQAVGLKAEGCDIQVIASKVRGGDATVRAIGLHAVATPLFVDAGASLEGATLGAPEEAVGLHAIGVDDSVVVAGHVRAVAPGATALEATALKTDGPRVRLVGARAVAAATDTATAVWASRGQLQVVQSVLEAEATGTAVGVTADREVALLIERSEIAVVGGVAYGVQSATSPGLDAPTLLDTSVHVASVDGASGLALGASRGAMIERVTIDVEAGSAEVTGRAVSVASGVVREGRLRIAGDGNVSGLVMASQTDALGIERTTLEVMSRRGHATGLLAAAEAAVDSSLLVVYGDGGAIGVEARAPVALRHVTLLSDGIAVRADASSAALDLANSALGGEAGVERSQATPAPFFARVAFHTEVLILDPDHGPLTRLDELVALGVCADCLAIDDTALTEEGRLSAGDNPLVDRADPAYATELDIDGEPRPQGEGPDIGCDERPEDDR